MPREVIRSTPNRFHAQLPRFRSRNLVNASLSILGRTFRTTIKEGASADDLIEHIAKENGGGVAKVYYPEFKTWEIVAVKIGDRLLVKGDGKRVAEADFSQFRDGDSVRAAAIAASNSSEGGIHFSLGESGIPMAATEEQGVVFPNAEELRIGKNTSDIALWTTSATFDPRNLNDIDDMYSDRGGTYLSNDALNQVAAAHGGDRNEKILLHDNILVLDKDTGEIQTVSEHASRDVRFMDAPMPPPLTLEPQTVAPTIQHQDMTVFDGRPERVSYLMVKTFDGAFTEHVQVGFHSLISTEHEDIPVQKPVIEQPEFSLLVFDTPKAKVPKTKLGGRKSKQPRINNPKTSRIQVSNKKPHQKIPTFTSAMVSWSMPRTEHIRLDMPKSVMPLQKGEPTKMPKTNTEPTNEKTPKRINKKKRKKPKLLKRKKKKQILKQKKKAKPRVKAKPKPLAKNIKKKLTKKKLAPETISKKPKKRPKVNAIKKTRKRTVAKLRKTTKLVRKSVKKKALLRKKATKKKTKKSHYLKELIGQPTSRKTTGRASARSSR